MAKSKPEVKAKPLTLASLAARVAVLEEFHADVKEELGQEVATELEQQRQDDAPAEPLAVGDRVRVKSGDWGNSYGVIKELTTSRNEDGEPYDSCEVDLEAHLTDAVIAADLLERA